MSTTIKETVERQCCLPRDLVPYKGRVCAEDRIWEGKISFCRHCGQTWTTRRSAREPCEPDLSLVGEIHLVRE